MQFPMAQQELICHITVAETTAITYGELGDFPLADIARRLISEKTPEFVTDEHVAELAGYLNDFKLDVESEYQGKSPNEPLDENRFL